ncbi:c-type cytochrome [Archaeoglobus neptunius]|uniref:c-type cytochrome n=1 Tax=Archaeoglobus neptunius TaxID=2798580 RepID=UPI0019258BF0|nr:cytochrome c [Archaeoglobus neptunius]
MENQGVYIAVGLLAGIFIALFIYSYLFPGWMMGYGSFMPGYGMPMMGEEAGYQDGRYYPPGCCQGPATFQSNGEKIYFTGINEKGERIPFTGGPQWLVTHGGSCVNCHGRDGRGGLIPMMCNVRAPDIRYSTLSKDMSDQEIKIAITKGEHEGEVLDWCMPRWQMSAEDLNDTIAYLKELG